MILLVPIFASFLALFFAFVLARRINKEPMGTAKMKKVYEAIREGSRAYLKRQYKTIMIISIVLAAILYVVFDYGKMPLTSFAFALGAICSLLAGYVGMDVATRANVRTAFAAKEGSAKPIKIAFNGGFVMGLFNVALSLLGVTVLFWLYGNPILVVGFGFGASLSALFAQLGGGIFTKAADVGADLVGKIEKGIPEDDPRNPAVIADNVGDNVGDVAGRGADLFESTAGENIGAMILGSALYLITNNFYFVIFPLLARAVGIFASIISSFFVRAKENVDPFVPLRNGIIVTTLICAIGFYFLIDLTFHNINLFFASLVGLIGSLLILLTTEYYTGKKYRPVKEIAESSKTGAGTNVIMGFAFGLESTILPVLIVCAALLLSYHFGTSFAAEANVDGHLGGVYGTAVATMGMLSVAAMVLGLDGFGPIVDNAGGIAEMSNAGKGIRDRLDPLDAVGNTTKALTKGYAMGSAGLAALLLFQAYVFQTGIKVIDLIKLESIIGIFIGALLPFMFSSF